MALDSAEKRRSAAGVPFLPVGPGVTPDATPGLAWRQQSAWSYSGIPASAPATLAAISGTATAGFTEADAVSGGRTVIISLSNDTWVTAGAAFDAQRQAILNGLDSAQSELTGWNAKIRDAELVTAVVRTSDTQVTITLTAAPLYDITANETITVTVPSSALSTSLVDVTGTPTFEVAAAAPVAAVSDARSGGGGIDPGEGEGQQKRRKSTERGRPYKPTGLVAPRARGKTAAVDARVDEAREAAAEIAAKLAREFTEESAAISAGEQAQHAARAEAEAKIAILLAKRERTPEDDMMLLLLMAGSI